MTHEYCTKCSSVLKHSHTNACAHLLFILILPYVVTNTSAEKNWNMFTVDIYYYVDITNNTLPNITSIIFKIVSCRSNKHCLLISIVFPNNRLEELLRFISVQTVLFVFDLYLFITIHSFVAASVTLLYRAHATWPFYQLNFYNRLNCTFWNLIKWIEIWLFIISL